MNSKTDAVRLTKLFAKKAVFEYTQKARPVLFFAFFSFAFYTPFCTVKSAFSYSQFIHRPIRTFAFSHFAFYTWPDHAPFSGIFFRDYVGILVPDVRAKFHQNRLKIATMRARTDRQTDKQTDTQTEMTGVDSVPCYAIAMGQIMSWIRRKDR